MPTAMERCAGRGAGKGGKHGWLAGWLAVELVPMALFALLAAFLLAPIICIHHPLTFQSHQHQLPLQVSCDELLEYVLNFDVDEGVEGGDVEGGRRLPQRR